MKPTRGNEVANFVAYFHGGWTLLTVAMLPLVIFWRSIYESYALAIAAINAASWIFWRGCPWQFLENNLWRKRNPPSAYDGDFVMHYVGKIARINVPRRLQKTIAYS